LHLSTDLHGSIIIIQLHWATWTTNTTNVINRWWPLSTRSQAGSKIAHDNKNHNTYNNLLKIQTLKQIA